MRSDGGTHDYRRQGDSCQNLVPRSKQLSGRRLLSAGPPVSQPRPLNEERAQEQPVENGAVREKVAKSQHERERNQNSAAPIHPARQSPGILTTLKLPTTLFRALGHVKGRRVTGVEGVV